MASDGKWYPPELHPSVREGFPHAIAGRRPVRRLVQSPGTVPVDGTGAHLPSPRSGRGRPGRDAHAGPQFPDLFQKASRGSHLADNVTVGTT